MLSCAVDKPSVKLELGGEENAEELVVVVVGSVQADV